MNFKKEKEKLYSRNFTRFGLDLNVFVSVVTALLVLAFSIFTILKPSLSADFFENIRLGGYTAKPEFNDIAWFSMMFSARVGIGIFFYGVAEPIYHLNILTGLQSDSA